MEKEEIKIEFCGSESMLVKVPKGIHIIIYWIIPDRHLYSFLTDICRCWAWPCTSCLITILFRKHKAAELF